MATKFKKGQLLYYAVEGKKMLLYPTFDVTDGFTSIPYRCLVVAESLSVGAQMNFGEGTILAKASNGSGLDDAGRYYVLTPAAKLHIEAIFNEWKGPSRRRSIESFLDNLDKITDMPAEERRKIELVAHKHIA